MRFPVSRRDDTRETLHGQEVADPYRWLEDPDSAQTRAWVAEQNQATRAHLDAIPSRPWFRRTMHAIVERPRAGTPDKVGGRYIASRNDGTQQQDLWFVGDTLDELLHESRLLIDPNGFSEDGSSSLAGYSASRDGRWLAYLVSDGGSDWTTIRLMELGSGREIDDVVSKVKFSDATWLPDHGSYLYLHFPTTGNGVGTEAAALPGGELRRHYVGESQDTDELVLAFPDEPRLGLAPELSHDGRWLVVHLHDGTSERNRLWVYPVSTESGAATLGEPLRLVDEAYAGFHLVRTDGSDLYLLTDHEAPLRRVVRVDLDAFAATGTLRLVDVVTESEHLLEHAEGVGEGLLLVHLVDVQPRVSRCTLDGQVTPVDAPGGAVVALHGEVGDDEVFLGMSTVTEQTASYRLDLRTGEVRTLDLSPAGDTSWRPPTVTVERRRATSKDGTRVPYFLLRRDDVPLDRPRPTLLWGYGGFAIPVLASYRPEWLGWLAAGGVVAVANLRGGAEFGSTWHEGGRLRDKQNVFDDFAAVGDHLVEEGVTTHEQLALNGRSNGGLLVGAVMTQRPDLAAVALPGVGVLDMLRFHLFTIGGAWVPDYGSPDDPEMFEVLRAYSPLHNLVPGTSYPATLVLTGDHDDRVVPAHSFKFAAALQHAQGGDAPVLARIETAAGHGAGRSSEVVAEETADLLAFAAEHTGLVPG
ncbi:MAG: prolyl oligopeptidase family serine peptidase [Nocardioidaceae bacterium]